MTTTPRDPSERELKNLEVVAGNGLLHRRAFLRGGAALAGAMTGYSLVQSASAQQLTDDPWSLVPGATVPDYGARSRFEKNVVRTLSNPKAEPRTQHARTPHHLLNGTLTPNGLHFVISHAGDPDIDPDKHRLVIHGLVKQSLVFTLDTLARYPMVSRMTFVECGGNSAPLFSKEPIQASVQALHGLVSSAEWTGVMLSTLLEETGIDPKAKWLIAEGADPPHLSRSVPLTKALDDAMVALYQNGERIMPGNGYPMRLLGLALKGPGFYEISGVAYSGHGRISKVMVSADGGQSWAQAALQEPVHSKAFTRFRVPWRWDGGAAALQSRAWDEAGYVQPTRAQIVGVRGETTRVPPVTGFPSQHYNAITTWAIERGGEVKHVYA